MADSGAHDDLVAQMAQITSAPADQARLFLAQADWDLQTALENFYAASAADDPSADPDFVPEDEPDTSDHTNAHGYQGTYGRTLGGDGVASRSVNQEASQPIPTINPSTGGASRGTQRGGMRTLRDLQQGSDAHGHSHSQSDDDDDDADQDLFAGGEKSGLAVQNPRSGEDHVNDIIRRAQQNRPRPGGDDPTPRRNNFSGQGQTLGGEDAPSTVVAAEGAPTGQTPPRVHRDLHLWRDGFSVDDGDLFRFDDPANAAVLDMINRGRAPLDLLNVEQGQEVDLQVHPHRDEDYKPPKKKYKAFSGAGQRLGSPTPAALSSSSTIATPSSAPTSTPVVARAAAATVAATAPAPMQVDDAAPTVTLQIRLGDGTQLRSRFNTTHTVGDVYAFVDASSPASTRRAYALMTTFPSKELGDRGQALGDMAEFKRGGVVVQKWT